MIDVEKKQIKSIEDYRHNIKLLKYHLKKQKKTNQKLKYQATKIKHRPPPKQNNKNRTYDLSDVVKRISDRLKKMGLILQDLFRMADSKYQGQINRQQFIKTISRLKTDLNDSLFAQMFYAVDTSLNGLIQQDQFQQFSIAYGGCNDAKKIRKYQNKVKIKLKTLLIKKYITVQKFLSDLRDPIPISKLSAQFKNLSLNNNQQMIMLKTFDPSHEGQATHKLFIQILKQIQIKSQQQQQTQQQIKTIQDLCVIFRNKKLNPMIIFQQADLDKKDGITQFQLQQAFKKIIPDQTAYQIKKWVGLININHDSQITKQQYINSIRGFYTLNQIDKFSDQYIKKHPQLGNVSQQSLQKIIKQLSQIIQDKGMTRKKAFDFIDFNKSGDIDKNQLSEGLKSLGVKVTTIGKILSLFDRNNTQTIDIKEWLKIFGEDVEMSDVQMNQDQLNLDSDEEVQEKKVTNQDKSKKVNSNIKQTKTEEVKKGQQKKKIQVKKVQKKESNLSSKGSKITPIVDTSKKNIKQSQSLSKKPSQISKERNLKKMQSKQSLNSRSQIKKKQTIPAKDIRESVKKQTEKPKSIVNKKFAEDQNNQKQKKEQIKKKASKMEQSKPKKQIQKKQSQFEIKKTQSKEVIEEDENKNQDQQDFQMKVDQGQQKIAISYKKNKKQFLKQFSQKDKKSNGIVNLKQFDEIMKKIDPDMSQEDIRLIFENHCSSQGINYKQWLQQIAEQYAQQVQQQKQEKQQKQEIKKKASVNQQKIRAKQNKDQDNKKNSKKQEPKPKQPQKQSEEAPKRGENLVDFSPLLNLIQIKGKKVDAGYKLFDYISDEQNTLIKSRQELLQKAKNIKKQGKLFKDDKFPPELKSIIKNTSKSNITGVELLQWKHYKDIYKGKTPQLFEGQIDPNDIRQGGLGNCYFLSSLASLAQYKNLIQRLFEYFDLENGYFLIWLCIDASWKLIQIDGYLPVKKGYEGPAFSRSENGQLWVSLLEKAYAKSYGNYNNIVGGLPFEAIKDLTGGPGLNFNFDHKNQFANSKDPKKLKTKFSMNQIWDKLVQANNNQYIMTAGTKIQSQQGKIDGRDEQVTKAGIVLGHAYSILDCQEVKNEKLLKLRNPWGQFEWKGDAWADGGSNWTEQMKKKLNHQINQNDGIFWIPLEHFYNNFLSCSINYIRPSFYYRSDTLKGMQQILISVKTKQFNTGYIMVSHYDHRHDGIPINTAYDGVYSLLGFICNDGKILKKFQQKSFCYERQGFVEFNDMSKYPQTSQALVLLNLYKSTNITVGYYGDKKADFQISRDKCIEYMEKLAYLEQNGPNAQSIQKTFKVWDCYIQNFIFLCFKNLKKETIKLTVLVNEPTDVKIRHPHGEKNVLQLKPDEIQCIKLMKTGPKPNYKLSFSF